MADSQSQVASATGGMQQSQSTPTLVVAAPPRHRRRLAKWARSEYEDSFRRPGHNSGGNIVVQEGLLEDIKAGKGCSTGTRILHDVQSHWVDARKKRGVLGLNPDLHKMHIQESIAHEFLPDHSPTLVKERQKPKVATTMCEKIQQREREAALAMAFHPRSEPMLTENRARFQGKQIGHGTVIKQEGLLEDVSAGKGCSTGVRVLTNVQSHWVDARRKRGVLGLNQTFHKLLANSNSRETFVDHTEHLRRCASLPKTLTMNERIAQRDNEAVLKAVAEMAAKVPQMDSAKPTEHGMNYQGKQISHGQVIRQEGLLEDVVAGKGFSTGVRVLTNVQSHWVDARRRRGVLGLDQKSHKLMNGSTAAQAYVDHSKYLAKEIVRPRALTMNERIAQRDNEAVMRAVEATREDSGFVYAD